jgi:hypothetical protein
MHEPVEIYVIIRAGRGRPHLLKVDLIPSPAIRVHQFGHLKIKVKCRGGGRPLVSLRGERSLWDRCQCDWPPGGSTPFLVHRIDVRLCEYGGRAVT